MGSNGQAGAPSLELVTGAVAGMALRLLEDRGGRGGVEQALHVAGLALPGEQLADPGHWVTHDDVVALLFAAGAVSGDPDLARHVGESLLFGDDRIGVATRLRVAGSPAAALRLASDLGAALTNLTSLEAVEIGDADAVVRATTRPGAPRHHFMCELTAGLLSRVPVMFGLAPAEVDELECQARGGPYCEYHLAWDPSRTTGHEATGAEQQLAARLARMGRRLDDIAATASDVRAGTPLRDLLSRVARRAARSVGAARYVLVVRPGPDQPVELHQHGFTEGEAWEVARRLWQPDPDAGADDQLVIDVSSARRTYGRLAAFFPSPTTPPPDDRALFSLYAGFAATALDLAGGPGANGAAGSGEVPTDGVGSGRAGDERAAVEPAAKAFDGGATTAGAAPGGAPAHALAAAGADGRGGPGTPAARPARGTVGARSAADDGGLEAELRDALDQGDLFVLYQPFIDLDTTEVVGVEALVRWRHPTRGVLEPAAFLPVAERSGLIVEVDLFVLREACRQLRQWADSGVTPLRMSVNVSGRDLVVPTFVQSVTDALREHGVPPMWLELEIGESTVDDPDGAVRRTSEELRQLGVRFAVSDFGAGAASLQQVASFPVSTLRIGRTFVQMLGPDEELGSLVSAIVAMAERLDLDCVAEGVESSTQSRILLQRGCTTAQGYFFSPPLFPNDVKRMLQSPMRGRARRPAPGRLGAQRN